MAWKGEQYTDLKFDYVDETDFIDTSLARRLAYTSVFIYTLKDILVYMADLGSISILVIANKDKFQNMGDLASENSNFTVFTGNVGNADALREANKILSIFRGTGIMFLLIMISLLISFILLAFEWRKANKIIKSRDISYAFTSLIAYRYYAIRSYAHYCLFSQIQNSRKTVDVLAFWVFFKFKGWKRLVLAEFPRQFLNMVIIYSLFTVLYNTNERRVDLTIQKMFGDGLDVPAKIFLAMQAITVSIWLAAFIQLIIAVIIYIPLLCAIRGNLKEYCVHKIDKRIDEILKRKSRKRLQDARKQERERIEHTDEQRPTLPQIDVDLDSNVGYGQNQTFAYRSSGDNQSDYSSEHGYGYQQQYSNVSYNNVQPYYHEGHAQARYSPNRQYQASNVSYATPTAGSYNPSYQAPQSNHAFHYQRRGNQGYEATRPAPTNRSDSDLTS